MSCVPQWWFNLSRTQERPGCLLTPLHSFYVMEECPSQVSVCPSEEAGCPGRHLCLMTPQSLGTRDPAFCTTLAVSFPLVVWDAQPEEAKESFPALGSPLLPGTLAPSPARILARAARNFKSGKWAREKIVMRTALLPPSAPFSLSLFLKKKSTSLSFCVWSAARDIWQGGSFRLASWEGAESVERREGQIWRVRLCQPFDVGF